MISKFADIDLHPDAVSNLEMGYLYEELIRRFSELSNETAGEHFTPREVIRLMVNLLFIEDEDTAHQARNRARPMLRPGLRHRGNAVRKCAGSPVPSTVSRDQELPPARQKRSHRRQRRWRPGAPAGVLATP